MNIILRILFSKVILSINQFASLSNFMKTSSCENPSNETSPFRFYFRRFIISTIFQHHHLFANVSKFQNGTVNYATSPKTTYTNDSRTCMRNTHFSRTRPWKTFAYENICVSKLDKQNLSHEKSPCFRGEPKQTRTRLNSLKENRRLSEFYFGISVTSDP